MILFADLQIHHTEHWMNFGRRWKQNLISNSSNLFNNRKKVQNNETQASDFDVVPRNVGGMVEV